MRMSTLLLTSFCKIIKSHFKKEARKKSACALHTPHIFNTYETFFNKLFLKKKIYWKKSNKLITNSVKSDTLHH